MAVPSGLAAVDHIILLMLENRSFDHMCGMLYAPTNPPPFDQPPRGQPFDGVAGKNLSNPIPCGVPGSEHKIVPVGLAIDPHTPVPDPGEEYPHVNTQLFGTINPPENSRPPFRPPYNLPDNPPDAPPMNGFVRDYVEVLREQRIPVTYDNYKVIMEVFPPTMVPVISHLARQYAVSDRFFCSVPTQTLPNRSFALAAASSGFSVNQPYYQWVHNDVETIFNRIQDAGKPDLTWRVYFDSEDIVPLTGLLLPRTWRHLFTNFSHMDRFYEDIRTGNLPSFSVVEPRLFTHHNRNDQHPPYSVWAGERLIYDIYQALSHGPKWAKTLFLITYDEHGGTFDHVPPPKAVPPCPDAPLGQMDFGFDRLGIRVPMVLVSPLIEPGTVFRAKDDQGNEVPLDHASIVKTVTARFGLPSLTARDAVAADFGGALTLVEPRRDLPEIPTPPTVIEPWSAGAPPSGLLQAATGILSARLHLPAPLFTAAEEALDFLRGFVTRLDDFIDGK
ncbi:MAG TPA: alkaline phosphatase family protein [Symbiobacteriaceae bacterium]|jgi:phospholipase C